MLSTTIQTTDEMGKELPISPDLRAKVQRAADLLEAELGEVVEKFDIESKWRFVPEKGGTFGIKFDLTTKNLTRTQNVGLFNNTLPLEALKDDESILRSLRTPMWHFSRTLSGVLKEELERIRRDLQTLATVTGE